MAGLKDPLWDRPEPKFHWSPDLGKPRSARPQYHFGSPRISVSSEPVSSSPRKLWLFSFPHCTATLVKGHRSLWGRLGERLTVYIFSNAAGSFWRKDSFMFSFKGFWTYKLYQVWAWLFLLSWLLVFLVFCLCTDIIMRPSCATGWFYYRNNCYGYFRKLRNWSDAEVRDLTIWLLSSKGPFRAPDFIWFRMKRSSLALRGEATCMVKWRQEGCCVQLIPCKHW